MDIVAEVVHQAVCEHTESDGYGHCLQYAVAGSLACSWATGGRYIPQIGSADIVFHPGPPMRRSMFINAETIDGRDGLSRGEFHAWIVRPGITDPETGIGQADEWVDFSSRHFSRMVAEMPQRPDVVEVAGGYAMIRNRVPEPWVGEIVPDYLWTLGGLPPVRWAYFEPLADCLRAFERAFTEDDDSFQALAKLTAGMFRAAFDRIRNGKGA